MPRDRSLRRRVLPAFVLTLTTITLVACAGPRVVVPTLTANPPTVTSPADEDPSFTGWWEPEGTPRSIAVDLDAPWSVVPQGGGGALVSQRDDGIIVQVTASGESREVGVVPDVVSGVESGLHGLALYDDGPNEWLYAYHGTSDDNRVVRMLLEGSDDALSLGRHEVVLDGIPRAPTHNGGRIAFGPDGHLYIATGDAGDPAAAQNPASLAGKILRATPGGEIVSDNPEGTLVYSLGHRNVQGLAWTSDGTMWASEFGQNTWDELNRIVPGGNYGWPEVEGAAEREGFVDPAVQWTPADASPSGIAAIGETVIVAGLRGERLWILDTEAGEIVGEPRAVLTDQGRLRDVVAVDEKLWILTNNTDGRGSPREGDDVMLELDLRPLAQ